MVIELSNGDFMVVSWWFLGGLMVEWDMHGKSTCLRTVNHHMCHLFSMGHGGYGYWYLK
jgi:hypothetical protein